MARVYISGPRRRWFIDYADVSGRRIRQGTAATTKAEALALLRARMSENTRAEILGLPSTAGCRPVPFAEFFEKEYLPYTGGRIRPSSYSRKLYLAKHVLPFFGAMNLRAIGAGDIERFIEQRGRAPSKPSPAELNRERQLLSNVLAVAYRRGYVEGNVVARVAPLREDNKRDKWLTLEQVYVIAEKGEPWLWDFILMAVHSGLRRAELALLKWPDLQEGFLRVGQESKGHKARYVPINSVVKGILAAQPRHVTPAGPVPFVFVNGETKAPYRGSSIGHAFDRAVEAVVRELKGKGKDASAFEGVTFHTLRHSFASLLIQAGVNPLEVQQYLGHSTPTMTARYAHLAPATTRRGALEILAGNGKILAISVDEKRGAV